MALLNALRGGIRSVYTNIKQSLIGRWVSKITPANILQLPSPGSFSLGHAQSTKQEETHPCADYMELKLRFRDIGRMNGIIEALGRDFLTAMPEGAYKSRLGQIAFLARRMHEDLANNAVSRGLEKASAHRQEKSTEWDEWDSANLREMETMYRHCCQTDPELIEKSMRLSYEGRRHHREVLANNDWSAAKVFLEEMIDLQRKIAESKCLNDSHHDTDPAYQALMREYIPDAYLSELDTLFSDVKSGLDDLLPKILDKQSKQEKPSELRGDYPSELQLWLNKSLLQIFGFDFNRGGLYETGHNPVEGGTPDDTRLVIKTSNNANFLESMKSTLHEGGHGLYIQGLPRSEWRYQPVGQDLGAAMQESQALLIEMIVGRMPEFFEYLSPRVEGLFQKFGEPSISAKNLYALKTRVKAGADRKTADEVTYFYHVHMRMKMERDLIAGRLKVKDLPEVWNTEVEKFTGERPQSYAQGCLQDVHWFVGKFGYYPAYTLGHIMAAQLFMTMRKDIQNLPDLVAHGQFLPIRDWLNQKIHQNGRLVRTDKLLTNITGKSISAKPLLDHLEERYLLAA